MQKKKSPAGKQGQSGEQDKDTKFQNQYQTVYHTFYGPPKTMLQVSMETGILRANICWYLAEMLDRGQIELVQYGLCPYTKFRAGFYSTDPSLFVQDNNQLNLFDDGL